MKYVSIDLETTGLDPATDQVLEVALVLEDTAASPLPPVEELPAFRCYVRHERYSGNAFALALNAKILRVLADVETSGKGVAPCDVSILTSTNWERYAIEWLQTQFATTKLRAIAAGKNVAGFDLKFFSPELRKCFMHRTIDPGSVCLVWDNDRPESLAELKSRFALGDDVAHTAIEDARDVIRVLRQTYNQSSWGEREQSSCKSRSSESATPVASSSPDRRSGFAEVG